MADLLKGVRQRHVYRQSDPVLNRLGRFKEMTRNQPYGFDFIEQKLQ